MASSGCRQREPIRAEPTNESVPALVSTIHMADPSAAIQLIRGFHGIEQNSWRWTMGKFAVMLKPPANAQQNGARLVLKFNLPDAIFSRVGGVTLSAKTRSTPLGSQAYPTAGEYTYVADVPANAIDPEGVSFEFAVDRSLPAGALDQRELALVVTSVSLDSK